MAARGTTGDGAKTARRRKTPVAAPQPEVVSPPPRKPFWRSMYFLVLLAIVAGGTIGHFWPETGQALKPLGDGFIKLVKMIIAPVIFLTISTGIAGMSDLKRVGRVAGRAFAYFLVFSTLALIIGLVIANVVQPGRGLNIDPATLDPAAVAQYSQAAHETTIVGFLLGIIPDTLVSAFVTGNILQTLFVSILFGVSLAIVGEPARPVTRMLDQLGQVVFRIVAILMKAAPVGAFGAFAFTIGAFGLQSVINLGALIATFYVTSLIFVLGVLGLVARAFGFSIFRLIAYLKEELLLVLGTSSSEAALPSLMQKLERAGAPKSVVGLVVPTGYSFNLDGTNIYMTLAALFIAQAMNIELSLSEQLALLLVAMLSSKGAAGITGSGFITLAATLAVVPSVPVAGLALILGIDRFMSECRALTNFIGNAVATLVVARWEGDLDRDALAAALGSGPAPLAAAPDPAAGPGDKERVTAD
ncbi:dicarboxylate/amino acid:cation symporter [Brevundimonas lenta]|uniref:C4-dicarboxylate transport protein n=1 Tax=Brevundimonas lenta TaxID=424796 RepID=A0A7W6NQ89_9CAUL|nr:dicarboxylate/amino acid:cation symporter [Brevundimonas lenta]MBB4083628.1 aerobic C4-dicarboxylate transport protein [Brevundimonas lenta]